MLNKTKAALQSRPCHTAFEKQSNDITLISQVNRAAGQHSKNCVLRVSITDSQILRVTTGNAQSELTILKRAGSNYLIAKQSVKMRYQIFPQIWGDRQSPEKLGGHSSAGFLDSLRCLRLISPMAAAIRKPAVLSSLSFTDSISSSTLCGTLAFTCFDLLFIEPVAISGSPCVRCYSLYAKKNHIQCLTCYSPSNMVNSTLVKARCRNGNAPDCWSSTEASNHNPLTGVTIMAVIQHTQTHPKFTWRFISLSITGLNVIQITADTEHQARQLSPVGCVMVFAGRLPFNGGAL